MGRGRGLDPSSPLHQYFRTGGSPRIGYSNPKLDELLDQEQQTFDPVERKKVLSKAMSIINEEAPACFMWRHKLLWGMSKKLDYTPLPDARVSGMDMKVLQKPRAAARHACRGSGRTGQRSRFLE